MARALHKLTEKGTASTKLKVGRHSDGGGLYLNVAKAGTKSWVFMWTASGKRREMGLGSYPAVSLAKARRAAAGAREAISEDRDPLSERQKEAEPSFAECVDRFLASMESSWRNDKHRAQWRMTLTTYCEPIRRKRVSEIDTNDVLSVLTPIWTSKPETASRLRGRIERVLDYAKVKGWRSGENPALWRGHLKNILPARQRLSRGHHAAMPYDAVPSFMKRLRQSEAVAARALEFTILTAARSGETREAVWAEIDFDNAIWSIPAVRMKAGREHRVPLTKPALQILQNLHDTRIGDLVFPGQKRGRPLSVMAMDMLLRRLKVDVTVHGFRSSFRDWAGEETSFAREVAEQALAHAVGDATERAYRRGDALQKRRELMEAWTAFLIAQP
ncbi:Integrase [Fulvimarina manganoxydans]|uniref:Integrase n=1 Tax=Fulvimarina manganoxydans TaxID=937218 RepID=A0A1W2D4G8_9HYPH|nr:site-specific integrase [Fulvimarina manganoxydans]SMC91992.1 Integrase [Fulvimarina manganoxydans]